MERKAERRVYWPVDCCGSGHHLFDQKSMISDRKACRCGKLQGFLGRNKSERQCSSCQQAKERR